MGALSPMHLILILGIALLILGPKRLPESGEALGRALREFREAMNGVDKPATPAEAATQTGVAEAVPTAVDQGDGGPAASA